jgi:hypothetical protein
MFLLAAVAKAEPSAAGWTPVAIATLLIALASAAISGWAIRQTWLYHPRPNFDGSWELVGHDREPPRPGVEFKGTQHGPGGATDVHLWVKVPGHDWREEMIFIKENVMHPGFRFGTELSLVDGSSDRSLNQATFEMDLPEGPAVLRGRVEARIEWRESPRTLKLRKKRFTFRVS